MKIKRGGAERHAPRAAKKRAQGTRADFTLRSNLHDHITIGIGRAPAFLRSFGASRRRRISGADSTDSTDSTNV